MLKDINPLYITIGMCIGLLATILQILFTERNTLEFKTYKPENLLKLLCKYKKTQNIILDREGNIYCMVKLCNFPKDQVKKAVSENYERMRKIDFKYDSNRLLEMQLSNILYRIKYKDSKIELVRKIAQLIELMGKIMCPVTFMTNLANVKGTIEKNDLEINFDAIYPVSPTDMHDIILNKGDTKYFVKDLKKDIMILFNLTTEYKRKIFLNTLIEIYVMLICPILMVHRHDYIFYGDRIKTFINFFTDVNTLPFYKFDQLENTITRFLYIHRLLTDNEVIVGGRLYNVYGYALLCMRLAMADF